MKNISYNREKVEECYFEEQAVYVCDSETEYKETLEAYRQKLDSKLYDVKPTLFEDIEMNIQGDEFTGFPYLLEDIYDQLDEAENEDWIIKKMKLKILVYFSKFCFIIIL